jgi:superfamily II DNA/RNA helicase
MAQFWTKNILSFRQLGLMDEIWGVLESNDIRTPTPIQTLAIPKLLKGKSALMTAQTGTGKTLAFATRI